MKTWRMLRSFEAGAEACGIEIEQISPQEALRLEPNMNPKLLAALHRPRWRVRPAAPGAGLCRLSKHYGADFLPYHEVQGLLIDGQGRVNGIRVWDRTRNQTYELRGDFVVNATGAWAGQC